MGAVEGSVGHDVVQLVIVARVAGVVVGDESLSIRLQELEVEVGRQLVGELPLPVQVSCDDSLRMWTPIVEELGHVLEFFVVQGLAPRLRVVAHHVHWAVEVHDAELHRYSVRRPQ